MFRRYSFFPIFLFLLGGLQWWAHRVESLTHLGETPLVNVPAVAVNNAEPERRINVENAKRVEMIEVMDRIVAYEHYYRAVYGHFTKLLTRVGFKIPRTVARIYDIRVVDASKDRLLVNALSEVDGKTDDMVSIDQDYQIRANFQIPPPRAEYLRVLALKHLRSIYETPKGQPINNSEEGIFRGYFRYEARSEEGKRVVFAVGQRVPVQGMQLEVSPNSLSSEGTYLDLVNDEQSADVSELMPSLTGQWSRGNESTLEEAFLAQRIFRGETGRYAKSWNELARITSFRFRDRDRWADGAVPFGDSAKIPEIDVPDSKPDVSGATQERIPAGELRDAASKPTLEIERVEEDDFTDERTGAKPGQSGN